MDPRSKRRLLPQPPSMFDRGPNENGRRNGQVLQRGQGYGFIAPDDGGADIFVHISNCVENIDLLVKGQRVRFDEQVSARNGKPEAHAVALL
jgi:cold shock protein